MEVGLSSVILSSTVTIPGDETAFVPRFDDPRMRVYMRRQWDLVDGEYYESLAVANVDVSQQRRGTFKLVLQHLQAVCPWNALKIEHVENPHLILYLRRLGESDGRWREWTGQDTCPSFFWFSDPAGEHEAFWVDRMRSRAEMKDPARDTATAR